MKKMLALLISLLMLMTCTTESHAEAVTDQRLNRMFTPEVFAAALNEEIAYIINALYSSAEENMRLSFISYMQLTAMESDDKMIWYDNQDWSVELSAYFKEGLADPSGCADTLTLSFPVGEKYVAQYNTIGVSVSALLSYLEKDIDFYEFSEYIDRAYSNYMESGVEAYEPLEYDGYSVGIMLYTQYGMNRMAIALIRDAEAANK